MDVLTTINTRRTPQTVQTDPRQVKNSAGGYTFKVGDEQRLHRFLTLGSESNHYTGAQEVTKDNADVIFRMAASKPLELVRQIVEVSTAGRAPKQQPAIFALAIAAAAEDVDGRRAALVALPQVCRTATHLFQFVTYVEQFRGWGPALKKAVAAWYTDKPVDKLAYQTVKYRNRGGWTHRDLLRLAHPVTADPARRGLFDFIVRGSLGTDIEALPEGEVAPPRLPSIVEDFTSAQNTTSKADWANLIDRGNGLSWEMLPDAALGHAEVWEALLHQGLPQTALIRQLPRLTRLGVFSDRLLANQVAHQLQDAGQLKAGRVHPFNVLVAQRTYASGRSARGDSTWTPDRRISDALDAAFYSAYGAVEPAGKRTLLALDVSGSMDAAVSGLPLTCREAVAALALVTAATEPDHEIVGFTGDHERSGGYLRIARNKIDVLDISPRRRLDDVMRYMSELPMGRTDCALPFTWATEEKRVFDTVVILTDNESYSGPIHVHQALRRYREKVNPNTRLVVVAMTATRFTVADPSDALSLDVVGLDAAVPGIISAFSRGDI